MKPQENKWVLKNNFKTPQESYIPRYIIRRKGNPSDWCLSTIEVSVQNYGNRKVGECESERKEAEAKAKELLVRLNSFDGMRDALAKIQSMLEAWEKVSPESFNKYCTIDAHIAVDESLKNSEVK